MIYRTDTRIFVVFNVICILFTTGKLLKHISHLLAKTHTHTHIPQIHTHRERERERGKTWQAEKPFNIPLMMTSGKLPASLLLLLVAGAAAALQKYF